MTTQAALLARIDLHRDTIHLQMAKLRRLFNLGLHGAAETERLIDAIAAEKESMRLLKQKLLALTVNSSGLIAYRYCGPRVAGTDINKGR